MSLWLLLLIVFAVIVSVFTLLSLVSLYFSYTSNSLAVADISLTQLNPSLVHEVLKQVVPEQLECQNQCVICLEEYNKEDQVKVLLCGHFYHAECLDQWKLKSRNCPECRCSISREQSRKHLSSISKNQKSVVMKIMQRRTSINRQKTEQNEGQCHVLN